MIRYAAYRVTTGEIVQSGEALELPTHFPPEIGVAEHDILAPLAEHYVDPVSRAVVPKVEMTLTLPGPTDADGVTEAVIDGLPAGTVCEFVLDGQLQRLAVSDGNLEIALQDPAVLLVTFWHPTYRHGPVEVTFV